jgi:sugar lactone lactonase YvrE
MTDSVLEIVSTLTCLAASVSWVPLLHRCMRCQRHMSRRISPVLPAVLLVMAMVPLSTSTAAGQMSAAPYAFPTTAVGSSSTQQLLLTTTTAESISSFTVPVSVGNVQEYVIGTVTGCVVDGATVNPVGTVCTVPVTFQPAYPGLRPLPLKAATSGGNVNFGLDGMGTGPLAALSPGIINPFAGGSGVGGSSGDGGPATSATIGNVNAITADGAGNIFFSDYYEMTVRRIDALTGIITTVAGVPGGGPYGGDGGPATSAYLDELYGVAIDSVGNLYIADSGRDLVRKVDAVTGIITPFAGSLNNYGYSGDGGPATAAALYGPTALAVDSAGNLYIADVNNKAIRKVSAATGIITTFAGGGTGPYAGDGGPALGAAIGGISDIKLDASGNLYIAVGNGFVVRKVDAATGIIHTIAGTGVFGYSGDGGPATSAQLTGPTRLALDAAGNVYFLDDSNISDVIRKIEASTGIITTIAGNGIGNQTAITGNGGPATATNLTDGTSIAVDSRGSLYVSGFANIRKIDVSQSALIYSTSTAVGSVDGTDDPQTVTLSNIGNDTLLIEPPASGTNPAISASWYLDNSSTCPELTTNSSPVAINPGASCYFAVDFAPFLSGTDNGTLVVTDNSSSSTQTFSLTGTATGTSLVTSASLTPVSADFGSQTPATSAVQNFTLTNTGTAPLTNTVTVTGTNASFFTVTSNGCTSTLAGGGSCTITVTFAPSATGSFAATLNVSSASRATTITESSSLTGTGVPSLTASAMLTPTSYNFPSQTVGHPNLLSGSNNFTLTNTGTAPLTNTVTITGTNASSFVLSYNTCTSTLAVGTNCTLGITFEPTAAGPAAATLNVSSASSTSTITETSSLAGTGVSPGTLTVTPNPISFPATAVNTTASIPMTLSATGGSVSLNGTQVGTLSGADASYFRIYNGSCGYSALGPGISCSPTVAFTPNAARTFNATLTITSTDPNSPAVIAITGIGGGQTSATLAPTTYNYGTVAVGSSATNAFTFTNTGTSALSISTPTASAPFSITGNTCGTSVASGVACTITVAFTPTTTATSMGTLSLSDVVGGYFGASLTGTGADTTPPVITVPANITTAATSAAGAVVTYTATANDAVDGAVTPSCVPASGSTFPLGTTTVTCTATDSHSNRSQASFTVTVQDTTPPVITVPSNITAAATSASGAAVTYTVTAVDPVDGTVSVTCIPASGSTFALGTTTVNCSAMDSHSNQSHASFTVTVQDTTPPVITVPANITAAATSASGAAVTYTATAVDLFGASVPVLCVPASGSTFALGTTTVNCSATDSHSNQAHASFTVTVQTTTPPVITVPSNITMAATSANGAVVTYTVTAVDAVDGNLTPSCAPASGSTFVLGTTTVNCSATDSHSNQSHASFTVTVQDTTPPMITVPANITAAATSANGSVVAYTATATDLVDGSLTPTCVPASGSTFTIGTTTVTCTVTDSAHITSTGSFIVTVSVQGPPYIFVTNGAGSVSSLYNYNGSVQSSAVAGGGIGAAVDRNGLVFSLTPDGTGVSTFYENGTLYGTNPSGLTGASALAIDGGDQLWIAAPGSVSMGQILTPYNQASYTDSTLQKPSGVAIDLSGNVWISDSQNNTVHEIVGGGMPTQPLATAVKNQTPGTEPQ